MNAHITAQTLVLRQQLAHENQRMREALALIADIAGGSTTANSLPNIARIARSALIASPRENTSLRPRDSVLRSDDRSNGQG
jgi:hypothetical protein